MSQTIILRFPTAHRLMRILNEQAIAGLTCVAFRRQWGKAILTFEPTPPDEPLRIWHVIPWIHFYQPAGWDHTLHDDRFVLYTRPLPAGTEAEVWGDCRHSDGVAGLLEQRAADGRRLAAVWQDVFYFVPAEPETVRYAVGRINLFNRPKGTAVSELMTLCNDTEPDESGLYFIGYSDHRAIFADRPGPAPAGNEQKLPLDVCHACLPHAWRPFGVALSVPFVLLTLMDGYVSIAYDMPAFWAVAVFFWLFPLFFIWLTRRHFRRMDASMTSPDTYPRLPYSLPMRQDPRCIIPKSADLLSDRQLSAVQWLILIDSILGILFLLYIISTV